MILRRLAIVTAMSLGFASMASAATDVYQTIYNTVDQGHLQALLKDMTGENPVTVGSETFTIKNRYLPAAKENYRKYWRAYFEKLGIPVMEQAYKTKYNLEAQGHNLEAVIPGKSPDSIVIIVHYDSMGPHGSDNEAVDDDMTGMAMLMETARILLPYKDQLEHTVRFVAADYEEWGNLEGARYYAKTLKAQAAAQNFKIVTAIDDEQSGWKQGANTFDIFDCGGKTESRFLGTMFADMAKQYSKLATKHACMGENSDHYAMWEIGVPAVVFSEHNPFQNDHFDHSGGDTYAKIDQPYYFQISQIGITFAAKVIGIDSANDQLSIEDRAEGYTD